MGDVQMPDQETTAGVKPVDDITARRAVAGVDIDFIEAGGPPEAADTVSTALRRFLEGDEAGARAELCSKFRNGTVDEIIDQFRRQAEATDTDTAEAA
jgi:hypothetical protein